MDGIMSNRNYKTIKFHFKADESQKRLISFLCHIAKNLYNYALYILYDDYKENDGRISLTKYDLNKICSGNDNYHIINTSTSCMIVFRAYENLKSFLSRIRKNKGKHDIINRPRFLPKNGETTITTQSFNKIVIDERTFIKMPVSNDMRTGRIFGRCYADPLIDDYIRRLRKEDTRKFYLPVPKEIRDYDIKTVSIRKRNNQYWVSYVYEIPRKEESIVEPDLLHAMGIDVGVNNLMACAMYDNSSFVIDGKTLKSKLLWHGRKMAYLASRRSNRKYTRRMQRQLIHINCMIDDYINRAVDTMFTEARRHGVSTILIGKNDGMKQGGVHNDDLTRESRRRINEFFVRIPLMRMIAKILQKAQEYRIHAVTINEPYTSMASFYDGDVPARGTEFSGIRFRRSLYRTRDGRIVNADINAALNILNKCSPEAGSLLRCMGITVPKRLQVYS